MSDPLFGIPAELADRCHAAWSLANEQIPNDTPAAEFWRIVLEREEAVEALHVELMDAWQGGGFPYLLLVDARYARRASVREARKELARCTEEVPVQ